MDFKVEKAWSCTDDDLQRVVVMTEMGHRCGYVGVSSNHFLYGVDYSKETYKLDAYYDCIKNESYSIDKIGIINLFCNYQRNSPVILFQVHGGLTYARCEKDYPITSYLSRWWFGYDCAHAGDRKDFSVASKYFKELEDKFPTSGILRSLEYCTDECNNLAKQLIEADRIYRVRRNLLSLKFS